MTKVYQDKSAATVEIALIGRPFVGRGEVARLVVPFG